MIVYALHVDEPSNESFREIEDKGVILNGGMRVPAVSSVPVLGLESEVEDIRRQQGQEQACHRPKAKRGPEVISEYQEEV